VLTHAPPLQASSVQRLPSSQGRLSSGVPTQTPSTQASAVQPLPSLQGASIVSKAQVDELLAPLPSLEAWLSMVAVLLMLTAPMQSATATWINAVAVVPGAMEKMVKSKVLVGPSKPKT